MEDSGENPNFNKQKRDSFRSLFLNLPVDDFIILPFGNWNQNLPENETFHIPNLSKIDTNHPSYHPCSYLWTSLCIRWDGTVVACCLDLLNQLVLGDRKEKDIFKIWNDSPILDLRHKHITGELPFPCVTCEHVISKKIFGLPAGGFCGVTSLARKFLGIKIYKDMLGQSGYLRKLFFK